MVTQVTKSTEVNTSTEANKVRVRSWYEEVFNKKKLAAIDDLLPRFEKIDGQFLQHWTACFQSFIRDHQTIGRQDQTVISEQDVVGGSRLEDIGIAEGN